ncbi:MAG: C25 family cysteine peptidase [Candidatus Cloacimonetes bacterium]|nr:C25 family cysteine peptidase [Candidatus Cloacimonadota bacterium]
MKQLFVLLCLLFALIALSAEQMVVSAYPNDIRLTQSNTNSMELEFTLGSFNREPVEINGTQWYNLSLKKAGLTLEAGLPQLPVLAKSVIIPGTAAMQLSVIGNEYIDLAMPIAPSKGNLTRDIDPDSVPYSFADFYNGSSSYPEETAYLTEPFIMRDYRGITVRFQPFQYFPATGTLRVYTKLKVALQAAGTDFTNAITSPKTSYSRYFEEMYQNMFLNFGDAKYPSLGEEGRILVIKHSMFDAAIQPWVDWKRQIGFTVDVVDVTVAGPTANQIKTYIQNQYDLNIGLMFVQIVGDAPQVPTLSSGGGGSDPSFALVAGGDSYPDIYVGRFSAQTVLELNTQVQRSVQYERDLAAGATWLQKGFGIASNEGGGSQGDMGESDQAHMELIRTDLLTYGYTSVDQVYQAQGATAAMVTTNLNQGRGFGNYVGHGSDTSWVTTGFNNANVNALTNTNMLPFVVSVACVNGNFVSQTCFAEAWLRATDNVSGNPTGAVAFYASTINQGWNPPMRGQDEVTDLIIANAKHRIGSLYYNGSSKMIEVYGTSGISEYKCWTIFGDASLMVRTKNPEVITATYNPVLFMGMSAFSIQTTPEAIITLTNNGTLYGKAVSDAAGNALLNLLIMPTQPMDLTLTIFAFNKQTYIQTLQVLPSDGPYIVVDNSTFSDGNNGVLEFGETIQLNLDLSNIGSELANGVSVTVSTTDSYATIVNPTIAIGNMEAGAEGTAGAFDIQIAGNVPDQHLVSLNVTITTTDGDSYEYTRSFTANAPAITWGNIQINDVEGNNNGRIDAGENVTLTFNITNNGHSQATNLGTTIVVNGVDHLIVPIVDSFTALPVGAEAQMIYNVTFSSQIPTGTAVQITAMSFFGEYTTMQTYSIVVGVVMENFESGFTSFPWSFMGGNWTSVAASYNGSTAAKSATISHNGSTSISVTMSNAQNGEISFWKKVSSEQNYDFLKFYINGTLKNQWSGITDDWSQATYPVPAGNNTFKWEYMKDSGSSNGSDCAWLDDIVFPGGGELVGVPVFVADVSSINFGQIAVGEHGSSQLTISNSGNASMLGTLTTAAPFSLGLDPLVPAYTLSYVIDAGEFMTFNVHFSPQQYMPYSGEMIITSDDPLASVTTVSLLGTGSTVDNEDPLNPAITALIGNYPNPFNPTTTIKFSLKTKSPVNLEIYNIMGQKVRTLVKGDIDQGFHSVVWNGKDGNNRPVSSGVYFYKLDAGKYTSTKKMIIMK